MAPQHVSPSHINWAERGVGGLGPELAKCCPKEAKEVIKAARFLDTSLAQSYFLVQATKMRRSLGKAGVSLSQLSSRCIRELVAMEAVPAYSERTEELNFMLSPSR